jgi:hydrogenase maturation protease
MIGEVELLILGLGNILLGDDGLGVAAVEELRRRFELPDGVSVIDGGTLGLSLLPVLQSARRVILVDAVAADAEAGSLVRLTGDEVGHAAAHRLSPHQVGVADLLDGLRLLGGFPAEIVLIGLVPQAIELSVERSAPVERQMSRLVDAVADEAASMGLPLRRRIVTRGHPLATERGLIVR